MSRLDLSHATCVLLSAAAACGCAFAPAADAGDAPSLTTTDQSAVLLVVAPRSFAAAMAPLVAHKTKTGMPARLVAIESLERNSGRDDAERVKRAIFEAHEKHGTHYVLLVGDAGLCPVRFRKVSQAPTETDVDCTYDPTDLYYADLYKDHAPGADATDPKAIVHSAKFDDWDADGDGAFDEQHRADDAVRYDPDHVDGCPDVAVGRLPVHTPDEAEAYVDKVIRYETDSRTYLTKMQKLAIVADGACPRSMSLCELVAGTAPARRLLLNWRSIEEAPPHWANATFKDIEFEVLCSGWIVYVGNATTTSWCVSEADQVLDAAWFANLRRGDGLRPAVFSVGGETGRFACAAPSERYVDESGRTHEFVRGSKAQCRVPNYDPFSSDYDQVCEESYGQSHPDYPPKCNRSAARGAWRDVVNGETFSGRLTVPRPCDYDLPENCNRTFACSWLFADGGAIVFAGESLPCPSDTGAELVRDVLARRSTKTRVLGDLWIEGQRKYWLDNRASEGVIRNPRIYLGIMTLFGDPSLRVPGVEDPSK